MLFSPQHSALSQDYGLAPGLSRQARLALKRGIDLALALALVILLSPLMAVIALIVRTDGGTALFCQTRIGRHGKPFTCYKFRSMHIGAEEALARHLEENPQARNEWQQFQKIKREFRVTRFGKFLRVFSLDELPQLINVIKGDMSLVGPRPLTPDQQHYYGDKFFYYTSMRPGLSGPWQVGGRNKLTFARRVELEIDYVRHWSLTRDLIILLKTFPALLQSDAAF